MLEEKLRNELLKNKDEKYKQFHQKLCTTNYEIIGVRIPIIRNLVNEYLKKYSFEQLYNLKPIYYEEVLFKGLLIGKTSKTYSESIEKIKEFIPLIDNWAICDTFCSSLKFIKKYEKEMREYILSLKNSKNEYELRFMIVILLNYYIKEEYLNENFEIFKSIKSDKYYVNMAISWAISICIIKYYKETLDFLNHAKVNEFIYKKSLQKAIESFRINKEQKIELKKLKQRGD